MYGQCHMSRPLIEWHVHCIHPAHTVLGPAWPDHFKQHIASMARSFATSCQTEASNGGSLAVGYTNSHVANQLGSMNTHSCYVMAGWFKPQRTALCPDATTKRVTSGGTSAALHTVR